MAVEKKLMNISEIKDKHFGKPAFCMGTVPPKKNQCLISED